jgi:regulator of protease activity HflC (stomatin/prohibitin superfamily)
MIFIYVGVFLFFVLAGVWFDKFFIGIGVGLVGTIIVFLLNCFAAVSAGNRGVVVTFGNVNMVPLASGLHFVNPFSEVYQINVQLDKTTLENASASTKDLQQVHTDITVTYNLSATKVCSIYKDYGIDVVKKVMFPILNEVFKTVTAGYNSEELVTKRDKVSASILEHIRGKLLQFDIIVDSISLVNFGFSEAYQHAIEQKVIATQQKQKAEQDFQRIQVEAQSRISQATGEAKAIAIQAEAVQTNGGKQYVNLEWIKKWNGNLPHTVLNGTSGMILNIDGEK